MTAVTLAIVFVLLVAMAVVVTWAKHAYSKRKHEGRVSAYLKSVREELGTQRVARPPHPHGEDETRELPAIRSSPVIRNAIDHIHTPTPSPQPVSTPMGIVSFPNDEPPHGTVVDAKDLPPQLEGQEIRQAGPMGMGSMSPGVSHSANDFHTQREQDQAVAQLMSQLADMEGNPWLVHQLEKEQAPAPASSQFWIGNYLDERQSPLMNLANQLSKLSAPLATWLEAAAVTVGGPGKVPCVKAGNRTITGATKADARKLNSDVIEITAPVRLRILAELHEFGKSGVFPKAAGERYWIAGVSNQLCVFFDTQAEAQEYADKLNNSYLAVAAKPRSAILAELVEVTDPAMGATLSATSPTDSEQLYDFRKAQSSQRISGA